jgi:hypothetical protein
VASSQVDRMIACINLRANREAILGHKSAQGKLRPGQSPEKSRYRTYAVLVPTDAPVRTLTHEGGALSVDLPESVAVGSWSVVSCPATVGPEASVDVVVRRVTP